MITQAIAATVLLSTAGALRSQTPPTILTVDLGGYVEYQADIYDASKYGKNAEKTPAAAFGTGSFGVATQLADIVAVNGQPAKGVYAGRSRVIGMSTTPSPGMSPADVTRTAIREHIFEFLQPDGTPIGTIVCWGFSGGARSLRARLLDRPQEIGRW